MTDPIPAELVARITGKVYGAVQARKLTQMGIEYRIGGDGKPLVSRAAYDAWMSNGKVAPQKRRPRLVVDAL